jgi:hypothetical protein
MSMAKRQARGVRLAETPGVGDSEPDHRSNTHGTLGSLYMLHPDWRG